MRPSPFLGLCLISCGGSTAVRERPQRPKAPETVRELTLTIVATNDLHGQLDRLPMLAGYVNRLREQRRDAGGVLLVDAGDMFQGTLESNSVEGASVIRGYALLGYDAVTIGNHELDFGPVGPRGRPTEPGDDPQGALKARIAEAPFPFVSANLLDQRTRQPLAWPNVRPTAIVEVAGVRVGLIGAITEFTPRIVIAGNFAGLAVSPIADAVREHAPRLRRAGADLVVLLAHAGGNCSAFDDPRGLTVCKPGEELFAAIESLPRGTIDAAVGGHTHAGVAHFVAGVPVVEAFAHGRAFGRIDFTIDPASRRVIRALPFPPHSLCTPHDAPTSSCVTGEYEGARIAADTKVSAAIAPDLEAARVMRARLVGVTLDDFFVIEHGEESALGNLIADLTRTAVPGVDVGIVNGGGIRRNLPPGPLGYGALFETLPFDNRLATVRLSGADLRKVLTAHLQAPHHGIASLSGIRVSAHCGTSGLEVTLRRESGEIVKDDDSLLVATSDYLATGGDGFFSPLALGTAEVDEDAGDTLRDGCARVLASRGGFLKPADYFDAAKPRLVLPGPRPIVCP